MIGYIGGLKPSHLLQLQHLTRRRVPADKLISAELARSCTELSRLIGRPIGALLTRRGAVERVVVGADWAHPIASVSKLRLGDRSLRGTRLVHTHLRDEDVPREDLTNLALLRLDLLAKLSVAEDGTPGQIRLAHLLPPNAAGLVYEVNPPVSFHDLHLDCARFISDLENRIAKWSTGHEVAAGLDPAILVSASTRSRIEQEERLVELAELARSAGITVLDRVVQRTPVIHPKYLMGSGKLKEVVITALQQGANLLIFDQDLSPAQARAIAEVTDLRVIDRTQLILDIFAQRAHTREGKVQVELAQLRYLLPRLSGQGTSLSRLGGGIGGRGPGETKLETDRRRVRDRIAHLERQLATFARHQDQRRARRKRHAIPVVSIVGYTNAGKSTLLNILTQSQVSAQNRLFETLDTSSRRLRFPRDREVIVTDTVGFIRDLPKDLMGIFRTTLRELRDADLLLHLVAANASDPDRQIRIVEDILRDLDMTDIPRLLVFNKCDQVSATEREGLCRRFGALAISAMQPESLSPLIAHLDSMLCRVHAFVNPMISDDALSVSREDTDSTHLEGKRGETVVSTSGAGV
ncbi:MAG: GTPase HflX [Nitrospiraceae bacterium]